jgi:hypothetical protein
MFETMLLKLRPPTRAAVLRMLEAKGDARGLEAVIDEALQAWLQKATCEDPQAAHAAARGYQWKSLFLPEGAAGNWRGTAPPLRNAPAFALAKVFTF